MARTLQRTYPVWRFTKTSRIWNGARCGLLLCLLTSARCASNPQHVETSAPADPPSRPADHVAAVPLKPVAWHWPLVGDAEPCEPRPADLGLGEAAMPADGLRLLGAQPTKGHFPTGVAVACVEVRRSAPDGPRRLVLVRLSDERASGWNQVLDGLTAVREATFADARGTLPDPPTLQDIVRGAGWLKCGYCVIYVRWGDPVYEQRVMGVVFDVERGLPAAAISASASVAPLEYQLALKKRPQEERLWRADFRADRDFERQVVRVLAELAARDRPAGTTQPNPWQTDRPLLPRDWRQRPGDWPWP